MAQEKETVVITSSEGEKVELNIELTFSDESREKDYGIFSEVNDDSIISIAVIEDNDHLSFLDPDNDKEEFDYVFEIFQKYIEENSK